MHLPSLVKFDSSKHNQTGKAKESQAQNNNISIADISEVPLRRGSDSFSD